MPEAMTKKPTRHARVIPCEAHFEWMLGWILTAWIQAMPNRMAKNGAETRMERFAKVCSDRFDFSLSHPPPSTA